MDRQCAQLNLSFQNLSSMVEKLDIFQGPRSRYSKVSVLKINEKRAVYVVKDNRISHNENTNINSLRVLKFILHVNLSPEQKKVYDFYKNAKHPNLCRIESIEKIDRFVMIVQEYVNGVTLSEYFERKFRMRHEIYKIMFELIFALDYIHSHSIVHGDIKPDNIIIKSSNNIKENGMPIIIDYDLGKDLSSVSLRTAKKPFGTTLYMSPELVNQQIYDFKTDVWSLGMTLYACTLTKNNQAKRKMSVDDSHNKIEKVEKVEKVILKKTKSAGDNFGSTIEKSYPNYSPDGKQVHSQKKIFDDKMEKSRSCNSLGGTSACAFLSEDTFDYDHLIYKINNDKKNIENDYGSLFFNAIHVMLFKDYRKRPTASKLKHVFLKSKYYSQLYDDNTDVCDDDIKINDSGENINTMNDKNFDKLFDKEILSMIQSSASDENLTCRSSEFKLTKVDTRNNMNNKDQFENDTLSESKESKETYNYNINYQIHIQKNNEKSGSTSPLPTPRKKDTSFAKEIKKIIYTKKK